MEWRGVVGLEGVYEISEYGHVRRLPIVYTGKDSLGNIVEKAKKGRYYPKIHVNKKGYEVVSLSLIGTGRKKTVLVHRMVAEAFLDDFSSNLTIDHLDCDKKNNHHSNLEAVTNRENLLRSHKYGTHSNFIPKPKRRKLTSEQVKEVRRLYSLNPNSENPRKRNKKRAYSQRVIAKMFGVSQDTVKKIVNNVGTYANVGL